MRLILLSLILSSIHFGLTIISLFNGFIIFRSPTTQREIFWSNAMFILLFPANVIVTEYSSEFVQTLAMIFNSIFWGTAITILFVKIKKYFTK